MFPCSARNVRAVGAALAAAACLAASACSSGTTDAATVRPAEIAAPATAEPTTAPLATTTPTPRARSSKTAKPQARKANSGSSGKSGSSSGNRTPASSSTPPPARAGWKLSWSDGFDGAALGTGWDAYEGPIASMPGGRWARDRVEVGNGTLKLHSAQVNGTWTSGGVTNYGPGQQTYGKYLVRFRMERAQGVKYAVLLWPASGVWPDDGEIDFAEDGGGKRTGTSATVHWGTSGNHHQSQRSVRADFSAWHTVGVEWTPGKLVYTLDGRRYGSVSGAFVPSKPMNLVLQTEAGSCGEFMSCADSSTPALTTMYVDWVAVYRPS